LKKLGVASGPFGVRRTTQRFQNKQLKLLTLLQRETLKAKGTRLLRRKEITARVFNFTALAERHGFKSISARRSFFKGGAYGGAEWWHFQWEEGLEPKNTTFGEELLKVYTLQKASNFVYWSEAKNCKWKVNWF